MKTMQTMQQLPTQDVNATLQVVRLRAAPTLESMAITTCIPVAS